MILQFYRMRSGQALLKLECYAFKENDHKEKIGHVLLNIRSAHLAYKYGDLNPKANWHKLIGLRSDLKTHKPELLLTLRIEDRKSANSNPAIEVSHYVCVLIFYKNSKSKNLNNVNIYHNYNI